MNRRTERRVLLATLLTVIIVLGVEIARTGGWTP